MFGKIHHFGYVYKDGEAAVKEFKSLFGIEKFTRIDMGVVKVARSMIGNLQVDLIEPQDKNSIFYTFLEEGNVGLHHVGFLVKDVDEEIKEWDSKGLKQVLGGIIGPAKFVYFDTTDTLGHITELLQIDYKTP
ncbi:MAG: VOC family protein [Candidatus Lokiarchaeota archaeon]|nr:VOC family protein [Candidatus Lokiarchaeota archaeon]